MSDLTYKPGHSIFHKNRRPLAGGVGDSRRDYERERACLVTKRSKNATFLSCGSQGSGAVTAAVTTRGQADYATLAIGRRCHELRISKITTRSRSRDYWGGSYGCSKEEAAEGGGLGHRLSCQISRTDSRRICANRNQGAFDRADKEGTVSSQFEPAGTGRAPRLKPIESR